MPDNDLVTGSGQVPPGSQSPDSNGQVPPASHEAPPTESDADSSSLTPAQLHDALRKAREQAAKLRVESKELAELRAYKQQQEDARLTQDQRRDKELAAAQERAAAAELKAQQTAIRAEVKNVAGSLGLNTALALRLLDHAALEFNDDGDPTNVAALLATAVEEYGLGAVAPGALNGATGTNGKAAERPQPTSIGATPANPARADGVAIGGWNWDLIGNLTKEQAEALSPAQKKAMSQFIMTHHRR